MDGYDSKLVLNRILDIRIPKGTREYLNESVILQEAEKAGIIIKIREF